jgi:hypothetical protein
MEFTVEQGGVMKLTDTQIQELYKFVRQHYVVFYDVQTELVDHLANDIETIFIENPQLSFEKARDLSFKKFGIFGFMEVIESRQKAMNKKYAKILWRFAKEWFTLPKIIITATVFLFFFSLLQFKYAQYIIFGLLAVLLIFEMVKVFSHRKEHKNKKEKKEKVFLLESMIGDARNGSTGFTSIYLFNSLQLVNFNVSSLATSWIFLISIFLTLLCILFYISNYVMPQKAEELLEETYPEYKFVKQI